MKKSRPAFPVMPPFNPAGSTDNYPYPDEGMTMRQYYKTAAPASEIEDMVPSDLPACALYIGISTQNFIAADHYKVALAKARGEWADAMLAEDEEYDRR